MDRTCNECGASEWYSVDGLEKSYPDRRREREQTVKQVYVCRSCDAEGRVFEDGEEGTKTYSGALRA